MNIPKDMQKRPTNELNCTASLGESTITRCNISLVWRRRQNMAAMIMLNNETKRKCFCFSFFRFLLTVLCSRCSDSCERVNRF